MSTLSNVETGRGQANPPSVRVAPDIIPEAKSSKTGVSVRYILGGGKDVYKDITGRVARIAGQKRVVITIKGLQSSLTTAYIPSLLS